MTWARTVIDQTGTVKEPGSVRVLVAEEAEAKPDDVSFELGQTFDRRAKFLERDDIRHVVVDRHLVCCNDVAESGVGAMVAVVLAVAFFAVAVVAALGEAGEQGVDLVQAGAALRGGGPQ